ncbi:MAG: hypothetical protein ACREV6_07020 [Clostridium sp.]|uniref:hypothetical protein n=1 Tax=Clostridium sp. TaxID=1506 RepID=UPI003D6C72F3
MKKKHIIIATIAAASIFIVGYFVGDSAATDRANKLVDTSVAIKIANSQSEAKPVTPLKEKPKEETKINTLTKLPAEQEVKGSKVTLKKVVQDANSIKIYVAYENKTSETMLTGDSQCKIISSSVQYEYNSDFNFERYYEKNIAHAPDSIEPSVKADSIIFFKPIPNVDKINVILNANMENYKFNNVKVEIK